MRIFLLFRCFNSIKVRLKQNKEKAWFDLRLFQFHKGTIKTDNASCKTIV